MPVFLLAVVCVLASAEATSRLQDWLRSGISVFESPDFDNALFTTIDGERQGKPFGKFGHISLNAQGFRGPEITLEGETLLPHRVMLLGSSETFGVFESPGKEYPAQLREILKDKGFEVINASLPGMTPKSIIRAFDSRLAHFSPDVVVIYFNPLFELNRPPTSSSIPSAPPNKQNPTPSGKNLEVEQPLLNFKSRFVQRLRDSIEKPAVIQRFVDRAAIEQKRKNLAPIGMHANVPTEFIDDHIADVRTIVHKIRECNAIPLVMIHATKVKPPLDEDDMRTLEAFLVNVPRATLQILVEYELLVQERVRKYVKQDMVACIDLGEKLGGDDNSFGDLVHFSDYGASRVSRMIADEITKIVLTTHSLLK